MLIDQTLHDCGLGGDHGHQGVRLFAPAAQRLALQAQAKYLGSSKSTGSTGAWLKERSADGHMLAVNIRAIDANGRLGPVRIFAFDAAGRLHEQLHASDGQVHAETGIWELNAVQHGATIAALPVVDHWNLSLRNLRSEYGPICHRPNFARETRPPGTGAEAIGNRPGTHFRAEKWKFLK